MEIVSLLTPFHDPSMEINLSIICWDVNEILRWYISGKYNILYNILKMIKDILESISLT